MKTSLLCAIFTCAIFNIIHAQSFGVSAGGATAGAFICDIMYIRDVNRFHLGFSLQKNGQKGEAVDERLSNYGLTTAGDGKYFATIDLAYSRVFKEKFTVGPEVSFVWLYHYTNYQDGRFSSDHYHLINRKEKSVAVGMSAGYIFHPNFEAFTGFNTTKHVSFGIRILI